MIIARESSLADQATAPFCRTTFFQKYVKIPTEKHGQITVTLQMLENLIRIKWKQTLGFQKLNPAFVLLCCGLTFVYAETVYCSTESCNTQQWKRQWSSSTGVRNTAESHVWIYCHLTHCSISCFYHAKMFQMCLV